MPDSDAPVLTSEMTDNGVLVITIVGDLDSFGTREVETDFNRALADRTINTVVNLTGVDFMSSGALAMLLSRAQSMRRAGTQMVLVGLNENIMMVFRQSGFDQLFSIVKTMDEAFDLLKN